MNRIGHSQRSRRSKKRQPKKAAFLAAYALVGNISKAAKLAGCNRSAHLRWLAEPEYAKAFEEAHQKACDALETEARRRAIRGTLKPVFHKGQKCGAIREYSDTLLIFLMKGANPEKYRERSEVRHAGGVGVEVTETIVSRRLPIAPSAS